MKKITLLCYLVIANFLFSQTETKLCYPYSNLTTFNKIKVVFSPLSCGTASLQSTVYVNNQYLGTQCSSGSTILSGVNYLDFTAQQTGGSAPVPFNPLFYPNGCDLYYEDNRTGVPEGIITVYGITTCLAGTSAPLLSSTSISNICPATTANLTSITASNIPIGTHISYHTSSTASSTNKVTNPSSVASGTYYLAFEDSVNNCYSPTTAVVVTINPCLTDTDGDGIPDINDVDDDNDGILDEIECGLQGNLVNNGSLTGPSIGTTCAFQSQVPSGWTATNITPETFSLPLNACMGAWLPSNDGGSWVVCGGWNGDGEAFGQTITGLTAGMTYTVSFEQTVGSNTRTLDLPAQGGYWEVTFGSEVQNSSLVPVSSTAVSWSNQTLTFTATSTSQQLQFKAKLDPSTTSGLSYMGIDGIKVESGSNCDIDNDGIPNHLDLDSDNDGCLDAIEGGAAITNSQLVDAGGIASVGPGSSAPNKNLCGNSSCVSTSGANIGLPQLALPLPTGYSNDTGQSIGDSQNASVSSQCKLPYCYKPAVTSGTVLDTKHGITALGRAGSGDADKWPMVRKGAWTALEAKTKGFVPNRLAFDASGNPIGIASSNFVEGMMVYDTTNNCLKIYDGTAWKCYTTQTCPD